MASPWASSNPSEGSSMCRACEPWCTEQVKKIAPVAAPRGLLRSWWLFASGTTIARVINRYATMITELPIRPTCQDSIVGPPQIRSCTGPAQGQRQQYQYGADRPDAGQGFPVGPARQAGLDVGAEHPAGADHDD